MSMTKSFRDTVAARAKRDPEFRAALIEEALQAFMEGDLATGRSLLRDAINATIGFSELSSVTGMPEKSLMRMVGPHGNPTIGNFGQIVKALNAHAGVRVTTHVELMRNSA